MLGALGSFWAWTLSLVVMASFIYMAVRAGIGRSLRVIFWFVVIAYVVALSVGLTG